MKKTRTNSAINKAPTYLTTRTLAERWGLAEVTLRSWRCHGGGPPYIQPSGERGKALYSLADIVEWESLHRSSPSTTKKRKAGR